MTTWAIVPDETDVETGDINGPDVRQCATQSLPMESIRLGSTVRLRPLDEDYLAGLVEVGGGWPPILVSRSDHVVVDGRYRFLAARELGWDCIPCELFDGDEDAAYIESIRRNVSHGLPLTLSERKHAAQCILEDHPEWSDRRIAELCAIAKGTVGRLRPMATDSGGGRVVRQGRDGKWRAVDVHDTRQDIIAALRANPEASLKYIARCAGSSVHQVREVRRSLEEKAARGRTADLRQLPGPDLDAWLRDIGESERWRDYVDAVPFMRIHDVIDECRRRAADLLELADALTRRSPLHGTGGVELRSVASM